MNGTAVAVMTSPTLEREVKDGVSEDAGIKKRVTECVGDKGIWVKV